jgi:hypothetical protein
MSQEQKEFFVDELYNSADLIVKLERLTNSHDTDFATIIELEGKLTHITIRTRDVTATEADAIEKGYEAAKEVAEKINPENVTAIHNVSDTNRIIHKK